MAPKNKIEVCGSKYILAKERGTAALKTIDTTCRYEECFEPGTSVKTCHTAERTPRQTKRRGSGDTSVDGCYCIIYDFRAIPTKEGEGEAGGEG